ncbi:hypothetical protein GBA52_014852 [Prunus armeniaca]|nr:hypothetical protein GBA52_014852 [Prunus armeniaca]
MLWRIGKGDTIKFWQDRWLNGRPLLKQDGVLQVGDVACNVSSFLKGDWWDIDKLRAVLDKELIPSKLQTFLWLVPQGKILSNEQRARRHLADDPAYDEVRYEPKKIIVAAVNEWYTSSQVRDTKASKIPLLLAWEPLELGQFKLNVDGSRRCASEAEVWGLFFGLQLAIAKGIRRLTVEMDAATVVLLVQLHSRLGSHPLAPLIASCCAMVRQVGVYAVSHIYRERNDVADCLAK